MWRRQSTQKWGWLVAILMKKLQIQSRRWFLHIFCHPPFCFEKKKWLIESYKRIKNRLQINKDSTNVLADCKSYRKKHFIFLICLNNLLELSITINTQQNTKQVYKANYLLLTHFCNWQVLITKESKYSLLYSKSCDFYYHGKMLGLNIKEKDK